MKLSKRSIILEKCNEDVDIFMSEILIIILLLYFFKTSVVTLAVFNYDIESKKSCKFFFLQYININ